jgi:hypothetical protein
MPPQRNLLKGNAETEEMKTLREALFGLSQVPTPLDDADDPNPTEEETT